MKDLTHLQNDTYFQDKLKTFITKHFIKETRGLLEKHKKSLSDTSYQFPKSTDFNNVWRAIDTEFYEAQNHRCAICEQEIFSASAKSIEHFRPKTKYWWLAYNPANYYLACTDCNGYKSDHFPVVDNIGATYVARKIVKEIPLLLNPLFDNPNEYFKLVLIIHPSTNKGIAILQSKNGISDFQKAKVTETIKTFNLDFHANSTKLDGYRYELLQKYYNELIEIANARLTLKDKNSFNDFLKQKLIERQELKTLDLLKLIVKKQIEVNTLIY